MGAILTLIVWGIAFVWLSWPGLIVAALASLTEYVVGNLERR